MAKHDVFRLLVLFIFFIPPQIFYIVEIIAKPWNAGVSPAFIFHTQARRLRSRAVLIVLLSGSGLLRRAIHGSAGVPPACNKELADGTSALHKWRVL